MLCQSSRLLDFVVTGHRILVRRRHFALPRALRLSSRTQCAVSCISRRFATYALLSRLHHMHYSLTSAIDVTVCIALFDLCELIISWVGVLSDNVPCMDQPCVSVRAASIPFIVKTSEGTEPVRRKSSRVKRSNEVAVTHTGYKSKQAQRKIDE